MPTPIKWMPDFELANLENPEGEPWLAASPDGRFSLLFHETLGSAPAYTDIEERIYTAAGVQQSAIGTTFSTATNEHQPASAYLPDGRRIYVWTEEPIAGGGDREDVYAEIRFGNNLVDVARFLVAGGAGRQHDPVVAANGNGFAIAMADDSVSGGRLILKFYSISGTLVNTVTAPNAPESVGLGSADLFRDVEITPLANGNYVIVWDSGSNQNIFARVYSNGGTALSGVIDVETSAVNAAFADVTQLADGLFVVTYLEYVGGNVFGQTYGADGTPEGARFAIGTGAANAVENQVQTAALLDGRFVTVWKTGGGDIAGQVMFADGTHDGGAFLVNTVTTGDQSRPTIATLADGRFAVSWESVELGIPGTIITTIFDPREEGVDLIGTTVADDFVGSAFADTISTGLGNDHIVGGGGDDRLNGGGGADVMIGGLGNDTYFVSSTLDVTDETTGGGGTGDYVFSTVSFTAAAGIERLYLTGAANVNATGGALQNDILVGNSGNNVINGLSGNDLMRGGLGNDTYYVDSTLDTTDEVTGGGGTGDYVYASVSFTASQGIERLYLTGRTAINATGRDAQNDILGGNASANVLAGLTGKDVLIGGLGNDTLSGGAGPDIFRFDTGLNAAANMDTITDFVAVDDLIQLENAVFTALTVAGALAAGAFNTGAAATQADDRIIYNSVTGALLYDADGLGGVAGVQFALLSTHPAGVSAADFLVF